MFPVNAYFESMLVIVNSILLFKSEFSCGVMDTLRSVMAVSYTHLDVYKRQDQKIQIPIIPEEIESSIEGKFAEYDIYKLGQVSVPNGKNPVSYTHLYMRLIPEKELRQQLKQDLLIFPLILILIRNQKQ